MKKLITILILLVLSITFSGCIFNSITVEVRDPHTIEIYNNIEAPLMLKRVVYDAEQNTDSGYETITESSGRELTGEVLIPPKKRVNYSIHDLSIPPARTTSPSYFYDNEGLKVEVSYDYDCGKIEIYLPHPFSTTNNFGCEETPGDSLLVTGTVFIETSGNKEESVYFYHNFYLPTYNCPGQ